MTQSATHLLTPEEANANPPLEAMVVRFAGDSGDGMQLTGGQFTLSTALAGNDLATFPDFPAEIRAPQGTTFGVSAFQINFVLARRLKAIDGARAEFVPRHPGGRSLGNGEALAPQIGRHEAAKVDVVVDIYYHRPFQIPALESIAVKPDVLLLDEPTAFARSR